MPNDREWQRRSDEWVKMTHESRLRKEKELAEKKVREKQQQQPKEKSSKNAKQ